MERRNTQEPFQRSPNSLGDPPLSESIRQRNLTATLALLKLENFYEIRSWVGLCYADALIAQNQSSNSCEVIEKLVC